MLGTVAKPATVVMMMPLPLPLPGQCVGATCDAMRVVMSWDEVRESGVAVNDAGIGEAAHVALLKLNCQVGLWLCG